MLSKLIKEYIRKFKVEDTDFLGVLLNIKNLKQLEEDLRDELYNVICRQLVDNMGSISLADHLFFLREMN